MTVTFEPRYFYWELMVDGVYVYSVDDFVDELPEEVNEEAACDMADLFVHSFRKAYEEEEKRSEDDFRIVCLNYDYLKEKFDQDGLEKLFVAASQVIADEILRRYGN